MTVADPDFELSAWLVAVTMKVPALVGAVYKPVLGTIDPPEAAQLTDVSEVEATLAVNCFDWLVCIKMDFGDTVTEISGH